MKKTLIILFYSLFVLFGALSVVFVPDALDSSVGSQIALFFIFLPLGYALWSTFGFKVFFKVVMLLSVFALLVEYIGLISGLPYGEFVYTGEMGYKIAGILPWTVGVAWTPLMVGSVALVYQATEKKVLSIIMPVIVLVVFDLLLDPAAVRLGLWSYVGGGSYYNVPIQNFLGWALTGFVGSLICFFFLHRFPQKNIQTLWYSFFLSTVFWSLVALASGLIMPLFFGLCIIGYCLISYYKNNEKIS